MTTLTRKFLCNLLITVTLILCISSVLIYNVATGALRRQYQQSARESLTQIGSQITYITNDVEHKLLQFQFNASVRAILNYRGSSVLNKVRLRQNFMAAANLFVYEDGVGEGLVALSSDGRLFGLSKQRTCFTDTPHQFINSATYSKILSSRGAVWVPDMELSDFFISIAGTASEAPILLCGRRSSGPSPSADCMLLLAVRLSTVSELMRNYTLPFQRVILSDADGNGLCTLDSQDGGEGDMDVISVRLANGWQLESEIPMSYYSNAMRPTLLSMLAVGLASLAILTLLCMGWTVRLVRPLRYIAATIAQAGEGDLNVRMDEAQKVKEYHTIVHNFNAMLESLRDVIENNHRIELEKRDLEIAALQAQINPHFLLNTIASVRWIAVITGAQPTATALGNLCSLLAPIYRQRRSVWQLREECEFLTHYIALMDMRFGERVSFSMDTGSVDMGREIPRFLLQPILENSYEHSSEAGAHVQVSLTFQGTDAGVLIRIEDDGIGMGEAKLAEIRLMLNGEQVGKPSETIGIRNVFRRLRLCYGDAACFDISSAPGAGVHVEFLIPDVVGKGGV